MRAPPWVIAMADPDIPDRFIPAIRWVIVVIALFVFFLLGAEEFKEGKYVSGEIFSVLFIAALVVAVKWAWFAGKFREWALRLGGRKVTMLYLGLAIICAIGLGFSIGKLLGRSEAGVPSTTATSNTDTGRIAWNFGQQARGEANFLNLGRLNNEEIRVVGFGAHGKNTSKDPITEFKGIARSDLTNEQLPIYIIAHDPKAADQGPFHSSEIPTLPEETFGIPGMAEFDIVTHKSSIIKTGADGVPVSKFLKEFGAFTVILEYDGLKIERHTQPISLLISH